MVGWKESYRTGLCNTTLRVLLLGALDACRRTIPPYVMPLGWLLSQDPEGVTPLKTAVPCWGQPPRSLNSLSSKRDYGPNNPEGARGGDHLFWVRIA